MVKVSRSRSLAKTITWRILATLTTIILVYIFTGEFTLAIVVGSWEVIAKIIIYYLHERAWAYVRWGVTE
ncbi:MAG: DUF2061 domain-containing protein [Halobacteriota archaeon]|nr:DUF2061 domain-containing protein [Halobacteriota archaeon]